MSDTENTTEQKPEVTTEAPVEAPEAPVEEPVEQVTEETTEELTEQYNEQSLPASAQIVYKPKDGIVEGDPHFGDPMCYSCCSVLCCIELLAVVAIVLVCCAYGTDGTCCDYCYWPF